MIAIIDYEAGNIKSVDNAIKYLGREAVLTRDRDIIAGADRVILPGKVLRIPDGEGRKVPQIGWNDLTYPVKGRLFEGVPEGSFVYFVHSFYVDAADRDIVTATTWYGTRIDASVQRDNVFACQFHPEKSEAVGMQILRNFLEA